MVCSLSRECMTVHMTAWHICSLNVMSQTGSDTRAPRASQPRPSAARRLALLCLCLYLGLEEITVDMKCLHNSQFTSKPGPGPGLRHDPCTGWPDQPGGEVCWNFYCLAGGSLCLKLHLDEWQNREKWRRIRNVWRNFEGRRWVLFNQIGRALNKIPSFQLFTKLHQLYLILEICFMIFSDLICCEFVQVLFHHKLGERLGDLHLHSAEYLEDKNKLWLPDLTQQLTRTWYHSAKGINKHQK